MLNKITLIGFVGADSEVLYSQEKQSWANFRMATTDKWVNAQGEKKERTEWHRCVMWGKLAENVGEHIRKGRLLFVEGSNRTREWTDKQGNKRFTTEVIVSKVKFLDKK
jgi:single-strand DNA-binding protein